MGAVVQVFYGPSIRPRLEGQAEVVETIKHLGGGRYLAKVRFLGDPADCVYEREIDITKGGETFPVKKR